MIELADGARRRRAVAVLIGGVLVALWGMRWSWGPELPSGADTTGHLQRLEFAWGSLFGAGHADGWFPGAMLGYQIHLLYGPGLALVVGLVRVATVGLVSTAGALQVVLVVAYAAVPWSMARLGRALGLRWWTAAAGGVVALAASSPRGGGIEGGLETALASQQVALPLVVLAMAQAVESLSPEGRGWSAALSLTVAAVALTHPLSLVLLGLLGPLVLAAAWAVGAVEVRRTGALVISALWAVGLTACWWLPALVHRDLQGPTTSWNHPGVLEHIGLLVAGQRGWSGLAGPVAAVAIAAGGLAGCLLRRRDLVALAALPIAALVTLHLAHGGLGLRNPMGMQLPNRGLVLVALLAVPITVRVLASMVPAPRAPAVWLAAVVLAVASVSDLRPPDGAEQRPTPALHEAAATLEAEMADGARFAFVAGSEPVGVPAPGRWLAWASGRPGLASFGPEYAPGAGPAMAALRPPGPGAVSPWVEELRLLAVSHLVVADPDLNARLGSSPSVEATSIDPALTVWALRASPGHPVGSVVPADAARVLVAEPGTYLVEAVLETDQPSTALAIGWSPGWKVQVDGVQVQSHRSPDGRLAVDLPAGTHHVGLQFVEPTTGRIGRTVSVVSLAGLALARRRRCQDPGTVRPSTGSGSHERLLPGQPPPEVV